MPALLSRPWIFFLLWILTAVQTGCVSPIVESYYDFEYQNTEGEIETQEIEYAFLKQKPSYDGERFPLIVALHGRGDAGWSYLDVWRDEAEKARFMVLAPTWDTGELPLRNLFGLIDQVVKKYPVDPDRIYLAGCSAGALKARWYLLEDPSKWSGVILISSPTEQWGVDVKDGSRFPEILFVHGEQDPQMPYKKIVSNLEILKEKGVKTTLIAYSDGGHDHQPPWTKDIMAWLQQHKKGRAGA
jgi:poly(3-hydroxybutyrate) depolymerase